MSTSQSSHEPPYSSFLRPHIHPSRPPQRLSEAKLSADAALLDPALLQRCLLFYAHTCQLQLRQMGAQAGQLPHRVPDAFRAQLEWYIEDIAEFLLFTLQ